VKVSLPIHFMQQWFTLSDPAMEDALHDVPLFRDFAGLGGWDDRLTDESTNLRFRYLLEKHKRPPEILKSVNICCSTRGYCCRPARWWTPRPVPRGARRRTPRVTPTPR